MRNYVLICSIFLLVILLGCTSQAPICNDSLCGEGEIYSCPADCDISDEVTLRSVWKTATPVAVTNWSFRGNYLDLVLKNNSVDTINVDSVLVNGYFEPVNVNINPNEDVFVRVSFRVSCVAGEKVVIDKPSIIIRYSRNDLFAQEQEGIAKFSGVCENESFLSSLILGKSIPLRGLDGQNYKLNFVGANFSHDGEVLGEWSLSKDSGEIIDQQIFSKQFSYVSNNLSVGVEEKIFIEKVGFSGNFGEPFVLYKKE